MALAHFIGEKTKALAQDGLPLLSILPTSWTLQGDGRSGLSSEFITPVHQHAWLELVSAETQAGAFQQHWGTALPDYSHRFPKRPAWGREQVAAQQGQPWRLAPFGCMLMPQDAPTA